MSKNRQGVEEIFDYNMTVLKDKLQTFDTEKFHLIIFRSKIMMSVNVN
jgi:hypothetical protein